MSDLVWQPAKPKAAPKKALASKKNAPNGSISEEDFAMDVDDEDEPGPSKKTAPPAAVHGAGGTKKNASDMYQKVSFHR